MKKQQFNLTKFETLQTSNNTLKGGFSQAMSAIGGKKIIGINLNCTNCSGCGTNNVAGCGSEQ